MKTLGSVALINTDSSVRARRQFSGAIIAPIRRAGEHQEEEVRRIPAEECDPIATFDAEFELELTGVFFDRPGKLEICGYAPFEMKGGLVRCGFGTPFNPVADIHYSGAV